MDKKKALRILCAKPDTDIRGLKKRYRELMRRTHPDAVSEHDYPYEVHEISEAYNYLLSHLFDDHEDGVSYDGPKIRWNAPENPNAYAARPIYQYIEDAAGNTIGTITVDEGKYVWIEDEDFPLFLKSLYDTARAVISDDDAKKRISRSDDIDLLKDITYLISGQFFGTDLALDLMKKEDDGSYFCNAMIELTKKPCALKEDEVLFPGKVSDHRLFVNDADGKEVGYLTFKDDRLLFGIIPLFERGAARVKIRAKAVKRRAPSVDADLWIRLKGEDDTKVIESINLSIQKLLEKTDM